MAKRVSTVNDPTKSATKAERSLQNNTCDCLQRKNKCICKSTKLIKKDGKFKIEPIKSTGQ